MDSIRVPITTLYCTIVLSWPKSIDFIVLSERRQYTVASLTIRFKILEPIRGRKSFLFSLRCHMTTTPSSPAEYK